MANCCTGAPRCNCAVTAGPGVTVDGNGSPNTPYVISAGAATPTPVQAGDTTTVDTTVSGTGTTADPYVVSADVILDPAPPAGGTNLAHAGPDGAYVECTDVRGCLSGGDGIDYDPATGEIDARPSTDAGNVVAFGTDGGLYAPAAAATIVEPQDSATVDVTVTGTGTPADPYEVSADVILDPAPPGGGTNLLAEGPGGLSLECDDVRGCFSATDPATYDPATGEIGTKVSTDAGNATVLGSDGGLYTPAPTAASPTVVQAQDTPTVDTTVTGTGTAADPYRISAAVILDPAPPGGGSNLAHAGPDGVYVECADVRGCFTGGDGIDYDPATGDIAARISTDAGNAASFGTDGGIYAAAGGGSAPTVVQGGDTSTADNTVSGTGTAADPYVVSTAVKLDPTPPGGGTNLLSASPNGLHLECDDVRGCFSAGDGAGYDPATGVITARLSGDAGNSVAFGTDGGLFAPPASGGGTTALGVTDSSTVDLTLSGTGTAADPYDLTAAVKLDPAPPGGGTNLLSASPNGLHLECDDVRGCFSAVDGATYDPATGEIGAKISTDAGNTVAFGSDGGLFSAGGGGAAPTAVQAGDTNTVDTTITGTGTATDPYIVKSDVIVAPGANGLAKGASGLVVAPSADAGNQLAFGADGKLFVPPDPPLEVGCGLQGAGTAADPLAAFPIAASRAWTADWDCAPAANSTLRCDPTSGALWAPPEHTSTAVTVQQNHPIGTPTVSAGGGFGVVDVNAWSEGTYTADSLTTCRGITFSCRFTGHVELTWPANATFELGYAIQINGGALAVRVLHGVYASGPARHERYSFGLSQASVLARHTSYAVRVYPAVRVIAGSVTFNQWLTDTDMILITR